MPPARPVQCGYPKGAGKWQPLPSLGNFFLSYLLLCLRMAYVPTTPELISRAMADNPTSALWQTRRTIEGHKGIWQASQ